MAKKKSTEKMTGPKAKGLFDHLSAIREVKDPSYFSKLTDADKKSWSNFMVCRFLSMDVNIIEYVNEIQRYQDVLAPEQFYHLCCAVTPKGKCFVPYVKNQSEVKWTNEVMEFLVTHFQESERNIHEYLQILGKNDVRKILYLYGLNEKDVDKMLDE